MPAYRVSRGWHDLDDGWMKDVPCRDVADPSIFFADDGRNLEAKLNVAEAKRVCMEECGQRTRCLDYAINAGINDGVWGATTGEERRVMRKQAALPAVASG